MKKIRLFQKLRKWWKYFHEFQDLTMKITEIVFANPKIYKNGRNIWINSKIYGNAENLFSNSAINENSENIFMDFNGLNGLL